MLYLIRLKEAKRKFIILGASEDILFLGVDRQLIVQQQSSAL